MGARADLGAAFKGRAEAGGEDRAHGDTAEQGCAACRRKDPRRRPGARAGTVREAARRRCRPRQGHQEPARRDTEAGANTLDGSWDKKLARGLVSPDRAIDLHGHNLSTAYATLDGALEQAIGQGDRVILLVTGKPPRPASERPHARGAIRASVRDWLAGSRHAGVIAAVRAAHPRHGGAGALYIILRRTAAGHKY
jgi:DNA-nicking Smr family endonuclease